MRLARSRRCRRAYALPWESSPAAGRVTPARQIMAITLNCMQFSVSVQASRGGNEEEGPGAGRETASQAAAGGISWLGERLTTPEGCGVP